ncbi:hypothetical protein GGS24DRAFT_221275 [Hypoxylon argillaceum]|nr:hypothetical protein GGS24DRAFT_221275 [Hypoxylon argillaceum]KAI1156609.1 hypothetical protein F4825DRAFT_264270 [Nemania diffusa]
MLKDETVSRLHTILLLLARIMTDLALSTRGANSNTSHRFILPLSFRLVSLSVTQPVGRLQPTLYLAVRLLMDYFDYADAKFQSLSGFIF